MVLWRAAKQGADRVSGGWTSQRARRLQFSVVAFTLVAAGAVAGFVHTPLRLIAAPDVAVAPHVAGLLALAVDGTGNTAGSGFGAWQRGTAASAVGSLQLIPPFRIVDTRPSGNGIVHIGQDPAGAVIPAQPIPAGNPANPEPTVRRFRVSLPNSPVPTNTTGVLINVTTIQGGASGGYLIVFPGDATAPNASTLNPITPIAFNLWASAVPTTGANAGTIAVFSTNMLDLAIDVVGFFTAPASTAGALTGQVKNCVAGLGIPGLPVFT